MNTVMGGYGNHRRHQRTCTRRNAWEAVEQRHCTGGRGGEHLQPQHLDLKTSALCATFAGLGAEERRTAPWNARSSATPNPSAASAEPP